MKNNELTQDYNVTIKGTVPLMHNRYPLNATDITKKEKKGKVFNAEESAKKCLYVNTKGEIYQPADHIEGALIKVGSSINIAGGGKKTYKDQMKTNILVMPTEIPFENGKDYETDVRLAVIPATRGRVPVARPRWDDWSFNFTIRVMDKETLDADILKQLLETAGRTQGIGTYRPKFGRFEVTKFEAKK